MTDKNRYNTQDNGEEKKTEEDTDINISQNAEVESSKSGAEAGAGVEAEVEGMPVGEEGDTSSKEAELLSQIEKLEQEKKEMTNRLLRLQADFDNYRKRVRLEKEALEEYANFNLIKKLLPVLDNLERASSASSA